jgi:hypothetical protein
MPQPGILYLTCIMDWLKLKWPEALDEFLAKQITKNGLEKLTPFS